MAKAASFSTFETTARFQATYEGLDQKRKKQADKAVALLFDNPAHPGLETHAIKPDKYYWEAYMNQGERVIFVREGSHLVLIDIVKHDRIGIYGKAPREHR